MNKSLSFLQHVGTYVAQVHQKQFILHAQDRFTILLANIIDVYQLMSVL